MSAHVIGGAAVVVGGFFALGAIGNATPPKASGHLDRAATVAVPAGRVRVKAPRPVRPTTTPRGYSSAGSSYSPADPDRSTATTPTTANRGPVTHAEEQAFSAAVYAADTDLGVYVAGHDEEWPGVPVVDCPTAQSDAPGSTTCPGWWGVHIRHGHEADAAEVCATAVKAVGTLPSRGVIVVVDGHSSDPAIEGATARSVRRIVAAHPGEACKDYPLPSLYVAPSAPSSGPSDGYWYCYDTGGPRPHHKGHIIDGDHPCTAAEMAR